MSDYIDRNSKEPVFRQIYAALLAELNNGVYDATGALPSEKELCARFDVERNTVRKALQILVNERRIVRLPGLGTRLTTGKDLIETALATTLTGKLVVFITQEDYLHEEEGESFHYKMIHTIEKRLSRDGYNLLFKSVSKEGDITDTIKSVAPQALIFDSYNQPSHYQETLPFELPSVSINHYTPLMTSIVSNNFDGAYQVAQLLANSGHRRIACILGKRGRQTTIERLSGVQSLCLARGIPLREEWLFEGTWRISSGIEAGERILAMDAAERPTAVFAFNDDMAYGCLTAFHRCGLSVPEDISVVGFDRSSRYDAMFPPITTVDVNLDSIVDYACWYLLDSLSGKAPRARAKVQIDTSLCDNGTVKNVL
jgi:DNA-binding LacI/PurR family transcriptional regulator